MAKGYIRIIEAVILIIVLFSLMLFIMKNNILIPANPSNPPTLMRYAKDLTNIVCNSQQDRQLLLNGNLTQVYKQLVYMTPPDYKLQLVVGYNTTGPTPPSSQVVYSYGCIISNSAGKIEHVTVQVWA